MNKKWVKVKDFNNGVPSELHFGILKIGEASYWNNNFDIQSDSTGIVNIKIEKYSNESITIAILKAQRDEDESIKFVTETSNFETDTQRIQFILDDIDHFEPLAEIQNELAYQCGIKPYPDIVLANIINTYEKQGFEAAKEMALDAHTQEYEDALMQFGNYCKNKLAIEDAKAIYELIPKTNPNYLNAQLETYYIDLDNEYYTEDEPTRLENQISRLVRLNEIAIDQQDTILSLTLQGCVDRLFDNLIGELTCSTPTITHVAPDLPTMFKLARIIRDLKNQPEKLAGMGESQVTFFSSQAAAKRSLTCGAQSSQSVKAEDFLPEDPAPPKITS